MDIFFPMAGQGARFGHKFKPFLTINSDTFIEAAVRPFRQFASAISRFIFVYLEEQEKEFAVARRLAEAFTGLRIQTVCLAAPTRGPAETISRAVAELGTAGPGFICDCDHAVEVAPLFQAVEHGPRFDALLPVWPISGENIEAWSVATVEDDRVIAIREKQLPLVHRGTPMGVIGCYGFRDIANAAARAESIRATNFSDVISRMLDDGEVIRVARIERAVFFGDPERLEKAQNRGSL